jgi:hypothetical protein
MGLIIDAGEVLKIKVSVDLRCCDIGVAEQLLDATQVLARLEQVRGEGMSEQVRMDMYR